MSNEGDSPDSRPDDDDSFPDEGSRGRFAEPIPAPPLRFECLSQACQPPRRPLRGRQGRDPICSKYRMAWVLVFFDLPVGTPEERKTAGNFRKDLVKDGYIMVQFSVYARPCGTADRMETHVRRLKSRIPQKGEVRGLLISDAQWGRMIVMRSQQKVDPEGMPKQMMFF